MERIGKWLTGSVVAVRLLLVVLTALAGAMADAGLTGGQVGERLVRSVSSSKSSAAEPVGLLSPSLRSEARLIA